MQFFIKDNYYFDIDLSNQLRISGPENHLFLGLTFPENILPTVINYGLKKGNLWIQINLNTQNLRIPIPIVTDIRTLRNHTEQITPRPTYAELLQKEIIELTPKTAEVESKKNKTTGIFTNNYTDELGVKKKYGSKIEVDEKATLSIENNFLHIQSDEPISLKIETITNIKIKDRLRKKIFNSSYFLPRDLFQPEILELYDQSQQFVEHLIRSRKTSSFEYGTIFPRDWIESADLGAGDLSQDTVDYMYSQSLQNIAEDGEAWHEDATGQFKSRLKDKSLHIDRKMIDIEPRFILGMKQVSKKFLTNQSNQEKLKRVAKYVLAKAESHELISFKQIANSSDYQVVGNWRDSYYAYPSQKSPVSPYDVNCIFYPLSLKLIREFNQFFSIEDLSKLNQTIDRWSGQKDKFRLYHENGIIGYSLALHGRKHLPLPIAHLDESYDMFYGSPTLEEIVSFAEKLIDPNFFYTPVGPMLVDVDDENFTTEHYHRTVIGPKQVAYAVAGLSKQYRRGLREGWPWPMVEKIKAAVISTSEACFAGWTELGCVPELYYYDEKEKRARLYTDQPKYEGQMSLIQLWSSVGCRRIIQEYASVKKIAEAM